MTDIKVYTETPLIYKKYVEPLINQDRLTSRYNWMKRVVDGEDPSVFYRDSFICLLPDITWSQESLDDLHILLIVKDSNLRSVRDISRGTLPLLQHIHQTVPSIVSKRYGIPARDLQISIHYHPSYYWLHMHITPISYVEEIVAGRSIFLSTVISNIQMYPRYYQDSTFHLYIYPHMFLYKYIPFPIRICKYNI
jgi:m7GpppX diphosphatase